MTDPPIDPIHSPAEAVGRWGGEGSSTREWWPLGVAVLLQIALMVALYRGGAAALGGRFTYPLDDTYIHMAMAKVAVTTGTWGMNPGEFSSATSSPVWTALLALLYGLFGFSDLLPLWLNGGFSVALLVLCHRWLREEGVTGLPQAMGLGALILLVPLPFLAGLGMEHVLQTGVALALVKKGVAATVETLKGWGWVGLGALSGVMPLVRYEGLFLTLSLVLLLLWRRQWQSAVAVGLPSSLSVLLYGIWSVAHGSAMVPNSLLMKSGLVTGWTGQMRSNLSEGAALVVLVVAILALGKVERGARGTHALLLGMVVVIHLVLARVGWLFRYEGWLMAWALLLLAGSLGKKRGERDGEARTLGWREGVGERGGVALLGVVTVGIPVLRAADAWSAYIPNCVRIERMDGAIATVLGTYLPHEVAAVHDIGLLRWRTEVPMLDLAGLASNEACRLHRERRYTREAIGELVGQHRVTVAVTEEKWMADQLPPDFRRIAEYTLMDGRGGQPLTFIFYGVGDSAVEPLKAGLNRFQGHLPPGTHLTLPDGVEVSLQDSQREGVSVQEEGGRIAFYTDGKVTFITPSEGILSLMVSGSFAEGRGPRFRVQVGESLSTFDAGEGESRFQVGRVTRGQKVEILYSDDTVDREGRDRNLFLHGVTILPSP